MAPFDTIPPKGGYNSAKAATAAPTRPNPEATNWAAAPVVDAAVAPADVDPEGFEVAVAVVELLEWVDEEEAPAEGESPVEEGDRVLAAAQAELMSVGTVTWTVAQMSEANLIVFAWSLSEHADLIQQDI